jgi:hypothetical protein
MQKGGDKVACFACADLQQVSSKKMETPKFNCLVMDPQDEALVDDAPTGFELALAMHIRFHNPELAKKSTGSDSEMPLQVLFVGFSVNFRKLFSHMVVPSTLMYCKMSLKVFITPKPQQLVTIISFYLNI